MFSKDKHLLTASTLNPIDRQNFRSVLRICDKRVSDLLRDHVEGSESTIQFLQIIRDIIECFMDHILRPLQRIRKIWYNVFLIRMWRQFILSSKNYTLKDNFLTANCYACIELNAHNLVQCILYLKKINKPELFKPFLYESQPCESLFRQLRSLSTAYSTVTNCTVKEAISRISNISFQSQIMHLTSENFEYPRFNKPAFPDNNTALPSADEVFKEIEFCQRLAVATATKLGLIVTNKNKCHNYECKIKPATPTPTATPQQNKNQTNEIGCDTNLIQLRASDLKNIQLKNYASNIKRSDIDEAGPYAEIKCSNNKFILVKKTSLCWLLGAESKKLSNDRLLRVMNNNTKCTFKKQIQKRSLIRKRNGTIQKKKCNGIL